MVIRAVKALPFFMVLKVGSSMWYFIFYFFDEKDFTSSSATVATVQVRRSIKIKREKSSFILLK